MERVYILYGKLYNCGFPAFSSVTFNPKMRLMSLTHLKQSRKSSLINLLKLKSVLGKMAGKSGKSGKSCFTNPKSGKFGKSLKKKSPLTFLRHFWQRKQKKKMPLKFHRHPSASAATKALR